MYFNLQLVQRTRKYHIRRRLSWNRVHNSCSIVVFVNSPLQQQTNKPILSFCSYIPELVAIEWTQFTAPQLRSFCIFTWRFRAITSITSVGTFRETVLTIVVALWLSWTVHFSNKQIKQTTWNLYLEKSCHSVHIYRNWLPLNEHNLQLRNWDLFVSLPGGSAQSHVLHPSAPFVKPCWQ